MAQAKNMAKTAMRGGDYSRGLTSATDGHHSATDGHHEVKPAKQRDWRVAMSDNVAYALLTYTGLQIFLTVHTMAKNQDSLLPYLVLILLVAGIIPACRWFEARWKNISDEDAHDPALAPSFRGDVIGLWMMAVGLPLGITAMYSLMNM